jgi:hypothetical protein
MGHQEPVSHCNTTYQIHIDHIQWSGGNSYGFMTANDGISFGSDLLMKCQIFNQLQSKIVMVWHQWATRSQYHIATPLIRSILMISNGLEATHMVS